MRKTTLSNGRAIFSTNPGEAESIFSQIDSYFQHGIQVSEGAVVFDIGANIGLFTLVACEWGARPLTVYAFEPVPALFEALQANLAEYGLQGTVVPMGYGVAEQRGEIEFTYYAHSTAFSTAYPTEMLSNEVRQHFHESIVLPIWLRWVGWLSPRAKHAMIDRRLRKKFTGERVVCPTISVSDVIRERGITRIDLLKLDAEKAELGILRGIAEEDWPKIRQMVMEVHGVGANLQAVLDLLAAHGFDEVVTEQDPEMESLKMVNLYARRKD